MNVQLMIMFSLFTSVAMAGATLPSGFLYTITLQSGQDHLYRLDWDGTCTDIGPMGFPNVSGLAWDHVNNRLYGWDSQFDVWLEINHETGEAIALGQFGEFTINPTDVDYSEHVQQFVAIVDSAIHTVDPDTGVWSRIEDAAPATGGAKSIAYAPSTQWGAGYFVSGDGGNDLRFYRASDWEDFFLSDTPSLGLAIVWDRSASRLIGINNQRWTEYDWVTGQPISDPFEFDRCDGFVTMRYTHIPAQPSSANCWYMDSDGDGDIDLIDFAAFQLCMGSPS
jgi:hypothetical protein